MALTTDAVGPQATVSLREVTRATVWAICALKVSPAQARFVAPNERSLLEAQFAPEAWFRAIYADDTPVGFAMLAEHTDEHARVDPAGGAHYLWRLMVAAEHQGKGYGRRAMALLVARVRALPGATVLLTSCGQGEGSPLGFYRKLGFEQTGEVVDNELVLRLPLAEPGPWRPPATAEKEIGLAE